MEIIQVNELSKKAYQIRKLTLELLCEAKSGHTGGSLSEADILSVLYFSKMNIDPAKPDWEDRDRFILSKGHACPALYATLALKGYFPLESLSTLRKLGSKLQGHPDMKRTLGIDISTGSLGQGLSAGLGMALASRLLKKQNRIYVLLGCGELQEGQVWEAAMAAAHYKAANLTAIIDYNRLQIDGSNSEVMELSPLADKWRSFGWKVIEIDGHNIEQIVNAFEEAKQTVDCPSVIIAKTVKGKGVSFIENQVGWHGRVPTKEELAKALIELDERMKTL